MSEYVRKQPLLEILKQESGRPKRMYDTKQGIKWAIEQIESGAFDADQTEVQRLRAAAIKLHETLNTYWQGDCEKVDVVAAQSKMCDALSTSTEAKEGADRA